MKIKRQTNLKWSAPVNTIVFISAILLCFGCASAQEGEIKLNTSIDNSIDYEKLSEPNNIKVEELVVKEIKQSQNAVLPAIEYKLEKSRFVFDKSKSEQFVKEKNRPETDITKNQTDIKDVNGGENPSQIDDKERFHWKYALIESTVFLGFQHGFRMTQEKTRRELGGPFFRDWKQSVKNLRGWEDGDDFFTNYIAHPGQGAITGRIFINNSDRAKKQEFGKSKKYWEGRLKAMAWSAVWSTQFELGPISEATIGNVGLRQKNGHSTMAYVDLVMTPTAGTGLLIMEDAVDKYFLRNWLEKKTSNKFVTRISRSLFNPTTSIANMLRLKTPWWRDNRSL